MLSRKPLPNRADAHLEALVDPGSFVPLQGGLDRATSCFGPEVLAGLATFGGRPAAVYAIDAALDKGFVTSTGATKIRALMDRAEELGIPVVALLASAGVSVAEGLASGEAYTRVITGNVRLSAVVPQIAVVTGVTMGAPAYSASLMDVVVMNKNRSHLMVTGPAVVERMLGETPTLAALGGAELHAATTGLADVVVPGLHEQFEFTRALLAMLPSNRIEDPPRIAPRTPSRPPFTIPTRPDVAFDARELIASIVDADSTLELGERFGSSIVTTFARIEGRPVGIVANQSLELAGAIGTDAADKTASFLRLCDAYRVPIITLIDVPGFLPGVAEESRGLLRRGAGMCRAMHTNVPRISVVVRKCYGAAAFVMMQTRAQEGDVVLALRSSRIAVMGFDAARAVVYPNTTDDEATLRARYFDDYEDPANAMRLGLVDAVIPDDAIRANLATHLGWLERRRDRPMPTRRDSMPT